MYCGVYDKEHATVEQLILQVATISQLKDKLHQAEVSHSATKGEV